MIAQHLLVHQTVVSLTAAAAAAELVTQWVAEAQRLQRPQSPQWSAALSEGLAQVKLVTHNFVTVPVTILGDLKKCDENM